MNGKQHLVSGGALLVLGMAALAGAGEAGILTGPVSAASAALRPGDIPEGGLCGALYFCGCLLPDIDQPGSLLGRYVSIEAEHRTWTHSIYPLIVLFALGLWQRPLLWLALGAFAHLLTDSFSKCGVAWINPFEGYRKYPSGAKIKLGWHPVLYTGETSAWVVCAVLVMLALWACWAFRGSLFGPVLAACMGFVEKTSAALRGIPGKAADLVRGLWPF